MMENGPERAGIVLVQTYENLASEDEQTRLTAAVSLLRYLQESEDQTKTIITRLFRGLCSGRKAARLGFATALTEVLYQLKTKQPNDTISNSSIIDILEAQTRPESGTTGQDERDHYFGRLFGIEAIIKSEVLFSTNDLEQWERLLAVTCTLALQKPWLRQACGWILYTCVRNSLSTPNTQRYAVRILEKLSENRLIRTPEGLAVWIEVTRLHSGAKFPKHVWKDNNPLSVKNLPTLADVLKDAKASSKAEDDYEVQGSAMWAANLHFVWEIVLKELFVEAGSRDDKHNELLNQFWQVAVDQALFAPLNSKERKQWGFLVMQRALYIAPSNSVGVIFSQNGTECLIQSLKVDDRYLQRSAQLVIQTLQQIMTASPNSIDVYILPLLRATEYIDFDLLTRTKIVEDALRVGVGDGMQRLALGVSSDLKYLSSSESQDVTRKLRLALNIATKLITQQVNKTLSTPDTLQLTRQIADTLLSTYFAMTFGKSLLKESAKQVVLEKTQLALENILKLGDEGQILVMDLVDKIRALNPIENMEAEPDIINIVSAGWKRLAELRKQTQRTRRQQVEGLALLYGLILLEISSGDTEAVQILQELLESESENSADKKAAKQPLPDNADALVEILLTFASRPSKFLRRITLIIFETLTSQIKREGLQSLTSVLEAKETAAGQHELFETNDEHDIVEDSEAELDSDVEMLDSDVEVINDANLQATSSSDSDSESTSNASTPSQSQEDSDTEMADADLLALETSLAAALGTRKLTAADAAVSSSNTSSDSDMTDSEMLDLDNKLAEVFRNRSSQVSKKKQQKSARENVINFKNRVLDMLEVYVRKQHLNPVCLDIIAPSLYLSRTTNTKQLADRAVKLVTTFAKKCSGLERVPTLPPSSSSPNAKKKKSKSITNDNEDRDGITISSLRDLLSTIHEEATLPQTSNAHRGACSKASILVVKVLIKADVDIEELDVVYAETQRKLEGDGEMGKAARAFLDDWSNWRVSVKGKIG